MQYTSNLQIKTCEVLTCNDLNVSLNLVLNEQLKTQSKAIVDNRQANLKSFLVDSGLSSVRVLYCAPELDTAADAIPRIDLKTD